ncbi:hypothetical protein A1O7_06853 [Cladophialophora yegresii CBS 114405]|uniref:HIT-type domain-containing protein n=1 Tax=Cladophialophora yegresii CBS 114405 TaxID=1182544 RepID=W9WDA5_9EURO|nr:uncharacterized protein A1O7_06853 [Cladophialophora yegresii CBS 114405]EXJ56509.1 hypothetical protein A1O7_06853 [Cladophialophora yegresii CBS 114405]
MDSCSLQCFKTHKSRCTHPTRETTADPTSPPKPSAAEAEAGPFGDRLIQDPRLQNIFDQYPNLRIKLKYIFDTATATDHVGDQSNSNARSQRYQTSPQKRIAHAMRILAGQLSSESAEASGLKAFAELVADLNSDRPGGNPEHADS